MYAVSFAVCKGQHLKFLSRLVLQNTRLYCTKPSEPKWYRIGLRNVFGKYLLLTNTFSSMFLMALGDLIQQEMEYLKKGKHENSFDWTRNTHMGIVGTFQGPFTHFFYMLLDKYIPGAKMMSIAKKIFLDQIVASPICIVVFFLGMNFLDNQSLEDSIVELKKKFLFVYATDCSIWIPIQFINFYYLSAKYRVMYVNINTMCYNVFLSYVKHISGSD